MHVTRSKKSAASLAAAVAALGLGLVGPATPVAAGLAASPPAGGGCLSAPANARQMGGGDGTDPNSVSLAETKAMEAEFQAGVQSLPKRAAGRGIRHAATRASTCRRTSRSTPTSTSSPRADGTGGVTDKMIRDQIKVMNDGYAGKTSRDAAGTPFSFKLKAVDRTANDDWYDWSDPDVDPSDDTEAKTALHRGTYQDLNIYIAALGDNLLGYAYYPNDVPLGRTAWFCSTTASRAVRPRRTTRATRRPTRSGTGCSCSTRSRTAATFPGDEVPDTAYQDDGDNIFECDESLDTCAQPGTDPVHNFMSYGDDPCLDEFTRGQSLRMTLAWLVFRAHR